MALGATTDRIVSMVLAGGAKLIAAGIVIGLAGSALAARAMRELIWNVSPWDPLSFAAVAGAADGRGPPGDAVARPAGHARQPGVGRSETSRAEWRAELQFRRAIRRHPHRYFFSHACTSTYQNALFCGLRIQCPSSGNTTSRDGTPCRCSAV